MKNDMDCKMVKLLPGWEDDQQLSMMFSPLPPDRDSNPALWDTKLNFWLNSIANMCRWKRSCRFIRKNLENSFVCDGLVPKGLDRTLAELVKTGKVENISRNSRRESSVVGWLVNLVWESNEIHIGPEDQFIVPEIVKEFGNSLVKWHKEHMSDFEEPQNLVTLSQLSDKSHKILLNSSGFGGKVYFSDLCEEERNHILSYILQKGVKMLTLDSGEKGLMFPSDANTQNIDLESANCLLNLRNNIERIENDISRLQKSADCCTKKAKECLVQQNRRMALQHLRRKRLIMDSIEQRYITLNTLTSILMEIIHAHTSIKVQIALKEGKNALKSLQNNSALNPDEIQQSLNGVEDALHDALDIDTAMAQGLESDDVLDAFSEELSTLMTPSKPTQTSHAIDSEHLPIDTSTVNFDTVQLSLSELTIREEGEEREKKKEKEQGKKKTLVPA